jgi:macrolide-specific efflux system membrane fusion protein
MKSKVIWFSSVAVLVLFGAFLLVYQKKTITSVKVKQGDVLEAIYGLGKVKSRQVFEVKIGVMANVSQVYVQEGERVEKGDKLISFEGASLFRAPFGGTVTLVELKEGEVALPQLTILRLENLSDKYIEVSLEQDAALRVKRNQKAKIVFESAKGVRLTGEVQSLYPKRGEFIAHINSDKIPLNILPGMTADVIIEVGKKKNVVLIPVRAISEARVVRLREEKKQVVDVEIGSSDGIWAELVKGDIVVTDKLIIKDKQ